MWCQLFHHTAMKTLDIYPIGDSSKLFFSSFNFATIHVFFCPPTPILLILSYYSLTESVNIPLPPPLSIWHGCSRSNPTHSTFPFILNFFSIPPSLQSQLPSSSFLHLLFSLCPVQQIQSFPHSHFFPLVYSVCIQLFIFYHTPTPSSPPSFA